MANSSKTREPSVSAGDMKFISHRGNLYGRIPNRENTKLYIEEALEAGFSVEIDVWKNGNKILLGHDEPTEEIDPLFLQSSLLWCHAKNPEALEFMLHDDGIHCFWHQNDKFTLTSRNYLWMYPGGHPLERTVYCMPEMAVKDFWLFDPVRKHREIRDVCGRCKIICSDWVGILASQSRGRWRMLGEKIRE